MALMLFAACSASPVRQHDPSPTTQGSAAPPDYRQLGESIEEAIASGSVALDTIGAVLINADGQTVLTYYRNGREPGHVARVFGDQKRHICADRDRLTRSSSRTSTHSSASSWRAIKPN
jgi:hypothetical protein